MKRDAVMEILNKRNMLLKHEKHAPLLTMEDAKKINTDNTVAKNLVLKDKKKYYFIIVKGEERVSIKDLEKILVAKQLSFAKEGDLQKLFQVGKGEVTPLGLLNDKSHAANCYIDYRFKDKIIGVHPLTNTETVWMHTNDLKELLEEYGVQVQYVVLDKLLG